MANTPSENVGVIPLGRSPWEQAVRKVGASEIAHLADDTGDHRYVVMTEEKYLAIAEAVEDAEHCVWQARNRDELEAERARVLAGEMRNLAGGAACRGGS
jgi:hypothetical protein